MTFSILEYIVSWRTNVSKANARVNSRPRFQAMIMNYWLVVGTTLDLRRINAELPRFSIESFREPQMSLYYRLRSNFFEVSTSWIVTRQPCQIYIQCALDLKERINLDSISLSRSYCYFIPFTIDRLDQYSRHRANRRIPSFLHHAFRETVPLPSYHASLFDLFDNSHYRRALLFPGSQSFFFFFYYHC